MATGLWGLWMGYWYLAGSCGHGVLTAQQLGSPILRSSCGVLGGSLVVISRVICPPMGLITIVTLLITPLLTTLNRKPYRTLTGTLNPYTPTYNYPRP